MVSLNQHNLLSAPHVKQRTAFLSSSYFQFARDDTAHDMVLILYHPKGMMNLDSAFLMFIPLHVPGVCYSSP